MTREEHLDWCKKRALEYVDQGDFAQAVTSMLSDIRKHPETQSEALMALGMGLLASGDLNTAGKTRDFIEGFN